MQFIKRVFNFIKNKKNLILSSNSKTKKTLSKKADWVRITTEWNVVYDEDPKVMGSENTRYWVKYYFTGRTHITSYGNAWPLDDYEILDSQLKPTQITLGNFFCYKITNDFSNVMDHNIEFHFKDIYGDEPKYKISYNDRDKDSFELAIKYLNSLHPIYRSYKEKKLYDENIKMKKTIQNLEFKINSINEKNENS